MDYQLMDQTLALVKREIEKFLADFPHDHPYQMAMSLPCFRQTLGAKMISKVLAHRRAISEESIEPCPPQFALKLLGEFLFIEEEICLMMPDIIHPNNLDTAIINPSQSSYYLMTNLQAIIQNSSFNVCQLLNLKRKEIIGQSLLFFVPQWQWEKFYYYLETMKQNASNEEITEIWSIQLETFQPQTSTCKRINVEIETTIHRDTQGEISGWHWLLQDISQRPVNRPQNQQDVSPIHSSNYQAEAIAYSVG